MSPRNRAKKKYVPKIGTADLTGLTTEASSAGLRTHQGKIKFTDANKGDTHKVSSAFVSSTNAGQKLGNLKVSITKSAKNGKTGEITWKYEIADSKIQFLGAGETMREVYKLTLKDSGGKTVTKNVTITIKGTNDGPVIKSNGGGSTATITVDENTAPVTTVAATDIDRNDKLTYAIAGGDDAAKFQIDANTGALSFKTAPDFEVRADADGNNTYQVIVRVSDGKGGTDTQTINVVVRDVNEAPTAVGFANSVTSLDENTDVSAGIKVADIVVTDDALGSETLSLTGADAGAFEIRNGNELFFIGDGGNPDFEAKASYAVTVNVNDATVGGDPDASQSFTLTINDVNEAPAAVGFANSVTSLDENTDVSAGIKVADIVVTDDALGSETLTLSGADKDAFVIRNGSELFFIGDGDNPDFEAKASYAVTVNVNDATVGGDPDAAQSFTLTINDVNEAPTAVGFANTVASLDENTDVSAGIKVADIVVTDDALGSETLILSGADKDAFEIRNGTELFFVGDGGNPDFEAKASYAVTVNVNDATVGGDPDAAQSFTLTINDLTENNAPVAVADTNAGDAVTEQGVNPGNTAFAGDPSAAGNVLDNDTDIDPNETKTVVGVQAGTASGPLTGGVGASIVGVYGTLTLGADGAWSYALDNDDPDTNALAQGEQKPDVFTYTMKDAAGATSTTTLTVTVTGTNDAPTAVALLSTLAPENIPGAIVGLLSATDPDAGDTVTYAIQPGLDASLFTIVGNQLRVGSLGLDFESSATRLVTVRATDAQGAFVDQTLTIQVVDSEDFTLTTNADTLPPTVANTQVSGNASTLNVVDNLDGGDGFDTLVLFGGGTFNLNSLAGFANFEKVHVVNITASQANLTLRNGTTSDVEITSAPPTLTQVNLSGTAAAGTILGGDGRDSVVISGDASVATVDLGNGHHFYTQFVGVSGDAEVGTILAGDGRDAVSVSGNASVTTIDLGNGYSQAVDINENASVGTIKFGTGDSDYVSVSGSSAWNPNIVIDFGAGANDRLSLGGSNQTFDLRPATLSGLEALSVSGSNNTVLIDADTLNGVTSLSGGTNSKIVTDQTALDLTGKSVSNVTIHSSNATGTTFTVDSKAAAFLVIGGTGTDTLQTTSFAFTALEREAIFGTTSIEIIKDNNGTFTAPPPGPNNFQLTSGADAPVLTANDDTVSGNASTLNVVDNLDGGDGFDSLVLFGGGTFNLNSLAGFANFEKVRIVNITPTQATLTLRNGTTSDVEITSAPTTLTQVSLSGTAAAGTILGGDGWDSVIISGDASVATVDLGNGHHFYSQFVGVSGDAEVGTILASDGRDAVSVSGNASVTTIDLGNGYSQAVDINENASVGTIKFGTGDSDYVSVSGSSAWNPNIVIDFGAGANDRLSLGGSNQTFDLRPATLSGLEALSVSGSNNTVLIDADTLNGVTSLSGGTNSKIVTDQTALDLTGKSVSNVTIHSSNATGTTFTVDSKANAFLVVGGSGADTLHATNFAFTALEREAIFGTNSVEVIRDTSGIYGNNGANTLIGTTGSDSISGGGGNDRLEGGLGNDTLTGGSGPDTFVFAADFGLDTILDFTPGLDKIEFATGLFVDAQDVLDHTSEDGVITLDANNKVTLNVVKSLLDQDDFSFG